MKGSQPAPPAGQADAPARPRIYGRASFGQERCQGCGLLLQRCYLVGSLCRICRGELAPAGQKASAAD